MDFAQHILHIIEHIGIAAFAFSGAVVGVRRHLDLFGVLVLGVITALGGGVVRDLLLGFTPPAMFQSGSYILVAVLSSLAVCLLAFVAKDRLDHRLETIVNLFDAIGLGLFVVAGVNATLPTDNWFMAITIGMLTGIGGGILRDIIARQIPVVLYKHVYALAALAGSAIYYISISSAMYPALAMFLGSGSTILIRLLALHFGWTLPPIRSKL